ncbi:MAG: glycosyltransferase family 4 protein [bacterium]|nr:glycosyltransferase family 4 protein [bacterium]
MGARVLQVIASTATGGGSTHLDQLIEAMGRHGFESEVCTVPSPSRSTVVAHDLVHAHGLAAALRTLGPCLLTGRPMLYTVHGWSWHPGRPLPEYAASWLLERLATGLARQVVCVAEADRRLGLRLGLLATRRVEVVLNAIALPPWPRLRERAPRRLRIGFAGRLTWQKGVDVLLEALAGLPGPDGWEAWIIGDGPIRPDLVRRARILGLARRIRWFGDRPDAPDLLAQTDLVVLPSRWEGLPYVALEAMAHARPVIGTAVNGLEEVLVASGGGLLVSPDDPEALGIALERLLSSASLRETCGRRGRDHVAHHHAPADWERRMAALYTACLPR